MEVNTAEMVVNIRLHIAIKYDQFKIFKIIFKRLQDENFDWHDLKDEQERNAYDVLKDDTFEIELYDHKWQQLEWTGEYKGRMLKQKFLEFLQSKM